MKLSDIKIGLYERTERLLGKQLVDRWYLDRCIRIYQQQKVIFIHIPKAAGTSVAIAVLGKRAGHFSAGSVRSRMGEEAFGQLYSFSVTRHPVDRIYSAYRYVKGNGGSEGGVRRHPDYDGPAFRSFETFVMEWLSARDLHSAPVLFKPQYDFLYDAGGNLLVNDVLKLEDPGRLESRLSEKLNRKIVLEKRNISLTDATAEISSEVRQRICELYEPDFQWLGY